MTGDVDVLRVAAKFAPEVVYDALRFGLAERDTYEKALREIVACDYRGNRPREQEIAVRALKAGGRAA